MNISSYELFAATSSPKMLIMNVNFWRNQLKLILVLIIAIVTFFSLLKFTYPVFNSGAIISIIIHLIGFYGFFIGIKNIAKTEIENSIIKIVEEKGQEYLIKVKNDPENIQDVEKLKTNILPQNESAPKPAMIRLFSHICKEAMDRKFESPISVILPYREESLGSIFELQNVQKMALHLGILGTFVGLIKALFQLSLRLGGGETVFNFTLTSKVLIDALYVSFSTSITGIEVSILIALLLGVLYQKQNEYFQNMEDTAITMLSLARYTIDKTLIKTEFGQLKQYIEDLKLRIQDQTTKIGHEYEVMQDKLSTLSTEVEKESGVIEEQTKQIQVGIDNLIKTKKQFDNFLVSIDKNQQEFIKSITEVYTQISFKDLSEMSKEAITQMLHEISQTLTDDISKLTETTKGLDKSIKSLENGVVMYSDKTKMELNEILSKTQTQADTHYTQMNRLQQQFEKSLNQIMNETNSILSSQKIYVNKITSIKNLITRNVIVAGIIFIILYLILGK